MKEEQRELKLTKGASVRSAVHRHRERKGGATAGREKSRVNMRGEGETQGKEEGAVAASSFAVAVGPWVAGERAGTEEEGGDRVRGRRDSREGERNGKEGRR